MRGKQSIRRLKKPGIRSIPAHAGETLERTVRLSDEAVNPRSCGGNRGYGTVSGTRWGQSPLMRGKLAQALNGELHAGSIPAHAGETERCHSRSKINGVNPRSCGGNVLDLFGRLELRGQSPLMRGKQRSPGFSRAFFGVNPRSCGGNDLLSGRSFSLYGQSPLMRGKQSWRKSNIPVRGSIPAHAGETKNYRVRFLTHSVNPRSCGGNSRESWAASAEAGQSPLMRGKPRYGRQPAVGRGSIPAHAGETWPSRP